MDENNPRICLNCGKKLKGKQRKFCSPFCSSKSYLAMNKDKEEKRLKIYYQKPEVRKRRNELRKKKQKENPLKTKVARATPIFIVQQFRKEHGCSLCGSKKKLLIHHWRYRLPISRKDFSVLCDDCHRMVHSQLNHSKASVGLH